MSHRDRVSGPPPLHHPVVEANRGAAAAFEQPHGVVGEHAERSPAVRDHVHVCGQLAEPVGQLVDRHIERTGQVTGGILALRSHIQHGDPTGGDPAQQLGGGAVGAS